MPDKNDKIVILILVVSVFLFLAVSKTISSGFHFVDDHEVIRIKNDLKTSSFLNVSKNWVKEDLYSNGRFRPLYYIHRVFETKLLGSDFVLWSLYHGVLCCMALLAFYLSMRNLKFTPGESIIFLIIAFIGPQTSVWWRLGPGESIGMVFLGFSFYFMSRSLLLRNYLTNNLLFIFFLILASLTKESFLIIIPGMILFKIWNEKINLSVSVKESLNNNLLLLIPLVVFCIELYIIKYHVGTDYAGLDPKLTNVINSILFTGAYFIKTYLKILVISFLLLVISLVLKKRIIELNLFSIIFIILILVPNIILYGKSGLVERYLLPSTFGLGFLVVTSIKGLGDNLDWLKNVILILIGFLFLPFMNAAFNDAKVFSDEGIETNKLLSSIEANYAQETQTMVIVDPVESYEASVSLKTYLFYENNIELFGYCLSKEELSSDNQGYIDGWKSYFSGKQYENLTSFPGLLIFLDNQMIDQFFKGSELLQTDYLPVEMGKSTYGLLKRRT